MKTLPVAIALRILISKLYADNEITFEQYAKLWEATE